MNDGPGRVAREWLASLVARRLPDTAMVEPVAVGWATVELERAAGEQVAALGGGVAFETAPPDDLLGARCLIARPPGLPAWVLLEPSTEGPLAAFLVRHGEGLAAGWVGGQAMGLGVRRSAPAGTPVGRSRLVIDGPRWGPFLLIVDDDP
ncbi:MAG TPA: hypothetical protein VH720_11865 [Candidatus Limnocylindrales bacterium]|jgi:hypothetical protein